GGEGRGLVDRYHLVGGRLGDVAQEAGRRGGVPGQVLDPLSAQVGDDLLSEHGEALVGALEANVQHAQLVSLGADRLKVAAGLEGRSAVGAEVLDDALGGGEGLSDLGAVELEAARLAPF